MAVVILNRNYPKYSVEILYAIIAYALGNSEILQCGIAYKIFSYRLPEYLLAYGHMVYLEVVARSLEIVYPVGIDLCFG